ncbi:MAG: AAA family ATPase [Sphingomonas sp.]|uniref:AAA family ATPase n=1 Tax=Sphingomonas sp. TaxID=28214 RepID=UPI001ACB2A0E|nr:AAA family ATPase [Sphingomonas sp.]MBN8807305.1 AAA family ATPase [Sphingomonas sp.]
MSVDLGKARRIAVIGCSGAGKSTLAARLAALTGLPPVHLDQEYWQSGWTEPTRDAWLDRITAHVADDRWISDGNYGSSLTERARRADAIVFLDFSTATCLWGVVRRTIRYRRHRRPDMPEGCPERWDWTFLRFVLAFRRRHRPRLLDCLAEAGAWDRTIVCRTRADVRRLLRSVEKRI